MMNNYLQLGAQSEELARTYAENRNYGKAYAYLLVCLSVYPNRKTELEDFFTSVVIQFVEKLYKEDRPQDLISTFTSAIEEYPQNITLLNSFGCFLVRLRKIEYAYTIVNEAITVEPDNLLSERNLHQIKDMLVPRWHFRMLNDTTRNEAYRKAILNQVSLGYKNVLDIGTGTGLLSLYASKAGAKKIQACDYSKSMYNIADKVFKSNKCPNINLQNMSSYELKLQKFKKVSLIVTEILDSGVLGENIINTVLHAANNLVLPDWNIVPCGVTIFITGIESESIFRKTRLTSCNPTGLFHDKLLAHSDDTQPYDTENLRQMKDVRYVTKTEILYEINFKDKNIKNILSNEKSIVMNCIEDGYIDAFAIWMTLKLDKNNSISSSPLIEQDSKFCCWDQAIYAVKNKFKVLKDESFSISTVCEDGTTLNIKHEHLTVDINSFPLPSTILEFLNDHAYLAKLKLLLPIMKSNINILDLSPIPILGLLLLKNHRTNRLACKNFDENEKNFIRLTAEFNDIDLFNIGFTDLENINSNVKFDVVILDWLQETGEFSDEFEIQLSARKFLANEGLMIPHRIDIKGLLVESKWLDFISKVSDDNVNNFKIAEFINKFQIKKHIDYRIDTLDFVSCSDVINFGDISLSMECIRKVIEVPITRHCTIDGVIYWYDIILYDPDILYSTDNKFSHIKNASFILDKINSVESDFLKFNVIQKDGLLKIAVSQ